MEATCEILWTNKARLYIKPEPEYLTPDQAASKLQMHPKTVRRLLNEGKIPGQRVGNRQWRISAAALQRYIEGDGKPKPEGD